MSDQKTSAEIKKAEHSSALEEQIREAQRRKDERNFLEELAKRITVAREGRMASDKKDFSKAITCYRRFINITAQALAVEVPDLKPTLFEERVRQSESLLLSSILFDILKILDKLGTTTAKEERQMYHRLFVRFTVGQPFQHFAAENLRKFLIYRKTVKNKGEFWATYNAIRMQKFCVVATWALEGREPSRLRRLRKFRDHRLAPTGAGRIFIDLYYRHGSELVRALDKLPGAKRMIRAALKAITRP